MSVNVSEVIDSMSDRYSTLSKSCKMDLIKSSKLFDQTKQSIILKEGNKGDYMYFLYNGCLRTFYLKDGKEITDRFAFEFDFISSIDSFYHNLPSKYNFELLEDTIFISIKRDDIFRLTEKHHCFEKLARIAITKTMLELHKRIISMQFETAKQKFDNLLAFRPDIIQRVPLTYIASYLGITLETLSRIRNPKKRI